MVSLGSAPASHAANHVSCAGMVGQTLVDGTVTVKAGESMAFKFTPPTVGCVVTMTTVGIDNAAKGYTVDVFEQAFEPNKRLDRFHAAGVTSSNLTGPVIMADHTAVVTNSENLLRGLTAHVTVKVTGEGFP